MKTYPNDPQAFIKFQSQAQFVAVGGSLRLVTQQVGAEDGALCTMLLIDMDTSEGRVCYQVEAAQFMEALVCVLGGDNAHIEALASELVAQEDSEELPTDIVDGLAGSAYDESDGE